MVKISFGKQLQISIDYMVLLKVRKDVLFMPDDYMFLRLLLFNVLFPVGHAHGMFLKILRISLILLLTLITFTIMQCFPQNF